jgi:hypothetical protein
MVQGLEQSGAGAEDLQAAWALAEQSGPLAPEAYAAWIEHLLETAPQVRHWPEGGGGAVIMM